MIAASLLAATLPLLAHHSFAAEYDGTKQVTLKGKLTEFEWVNPHSWVHFDVTDDKGRNRLVMADLGQFLFFFLDRVISMR